ncbi:DKNYY domain-containing protein [Xanthobacteraceae bacterium A53D]
MTERSEFLAGDVRIPVIPYDLFEAANLFLDTGRTPEEVLPRIGLSPEEWAPLKAAYRWFPYALGETDRRRYFPGLEDSDILPLVLPPRWNLKPGQEPDLRMTGHIRDQVRQNPFIGPFADCGWPYHFIAGHPEATLCAYTHDGRTVYFHGRPLTDRQGAPLDVDAPSFEAVGGRWLMDRNHVYGQGTFGANRTFYWYVQADVDRASFEVLNLMYARDKARAYYITGKAIRTKSPEAFAIVPLLRLNYRDETCDFLRQGSHMARDGQAVYAYGARLKGAKPAGFRMLGMGYATDGEKVWFMEEKALIEGADAATFTVPGPGEPAANRSHGPRGVTDRLRPYVRAAAVDPQDWFEDWRPFFEARPDLDGWWWHEMAKTRG